MRKGLSGCWFRALWLKRWGQNSGVFGEDGFEWLPDGVVRTVRERRSGFEFLRVCWTRKTG
ncbi:hypothetical protein KY285_001032 [Solanum tuberosum]|nr:hypothetical protein KY285_001032 [Solanum tuberosum]